MTPTDEDRERARELSPCTCWDVNAPHPDFERGPLKDGSHYANCPSENQQDIAEALATARRAGVVGMRDAAFRIAYEAHTMGRIYGKDSITKAECDAIERMVQREIDRALADEMENEQ